MCAHEEEVTISADADRAVRRRARPHRRSGARADGAHLVSGTQPRDGASHLAEDAAGRRDNFSRHGRSAVGRRVADHRPALRPPSLRLLPRVDRREPRPHTGREFLNLLGGHLWKTTRADGILTAAYRANVPIFCPAIADSSIGMGLSQARQKSPGAGYIDIIGDIVESANVIIRRPRTASVVLGGGTPKNFINQASVQAEFYSDEVGGHRYALQIVTDVPHFGGASGSSLEEAQSWGKLATDSDKVSVQADATIALPLLASALATSVKDVLANRRMPAFTLGRVMTIDGQPVPSDRFEEVNESAV
ncbi:MAG: hypothetical protein DMG04_15875 [Acidobacteria bacterium]|nr:MAG: hypothetical protein DMG04_15875 [Acidobacteriota bacterium]